MTTCCPAGSVDTVITSPPYVQLRNYDVAGQIGLEGHVDATNADAFLLLSVPIYDGGVRDAQLRAAQAQASAAASELVVASKITAAVARDYYDHGLGTLTDATSAQTALLQAEFAKAKARSDALTAAATIAFASGALTNRDTLGAR